MALPSRNFLIVFFLLLPTQILSSPLFELGMSNDNYSYKSDHGLSPQKKTYDIGIQIPKTPIQLRWVAGVVEDIESTGGFLGGYHIEEYARFFEGRCMISHSLGEGAVFANIAVGVGLLNVEQKEMTKKIEYLGDGFFGKQKTTTYSTTAPYKSSWYMTLPLECSVYLDVGVDIGFCLWATFSSYQTANGAVIKFGI